jgi:hypothetical protein
MTVTANGPVPDLDDEGFPLFPPLPGGRPLAVGARSLARLVASIRTGVLTARTDALAAMIVFYEREPIDGFAETASGRTTGPDALDELVEVPIAGVAVTETSPELALAVGSYLLPTEIRDLPARVVVPELFLRSLGRPGQRGCLLIRTPAALGLVFLEEEQVLLGCRQDGTSGGLEAVADLWEHPEARLWARLGPARSAPTTIPTRMPFAASANEAAPPQAAAATATAWPAWQPPPPADPWIAAEQPAAETASPLPPLRPWSEEGAVPIPAWAAPEPAPPAPAQDRLGAVLGEVRAVLGPQAARVEELFRSAPATVEGLRAAAESLRRQRLRLISPATLGVVADRVLAVLDRG